MKLFQREIESCRGCPNCIHIESPWSGKLLSGPEAAKQMGVFVDPAMQYTSNAAMCKDLLEMLPVIVVVEKKAWPLKDKRKTMPTFVIPANCPLPNIGSTAAAGGMTARELAEKVRAVLAEVK